VRKIFVRRVSVSINAAFEIVPKVSVFIESLAVPSVLRNFFAGKVIRTG